MNSLLGGLSMTLKQSELPAFDEFAFLKLQIFLMPSVYPFFVFFFSPSGVEFGILTLLRCWEKSVHLSDLEVCVRILGPVM